MVFGALVLIFSLFYFGRYAKKNFNEMIEENQSNKNLLTNLNEEEIKSMSSKTTSNI
jgi:hypothetical protein